VAARRARGPPTLPVSLAVERATNPFLRVDNADVAQWCSRRGAAADDRVSRFAALRSAKDDFR
jgi:hydroxyacylglutathione hydrolase